MIFVLLSAVLGSTITRLDSITVFGDSWSDVGNGSFQISNGTWPLGTYYNHRFSNGPIWVDSLASHFDKIPVQSFSVGGATVNSSIVQGYTGSAGDIPSPSVTEQIDFYLANRVGRNGTYILWAGGNDYFFGAKSPKQIAANLVSNAERLIEFGSVFIINLPPLQYLPYMKNSTSHVALKFAQLAEWHNANLTSILNSRKGIDLINIHDNWKAITDGFGNTTSACLDSSVCQDPQNYVFWDKFHFTTAINDRIAKLVLKYLE